MNYDVYRKALEAFLANRKDEALELAKKSQTPEGDNMVARLSPAPPTTTEQAAAYAPALEAFLAGDETKALTLAEALRGVPEADNLAQRIRGRRGE